MAVIKVIELIGTSPKGWHDAVEEESTEYRAAVKIAFVVEKAKK